MSDACSASGRSYSEIGELINFKILWKTIIYLKFLNKNKRKINIVNLPLSLSRIDEYRSAHYSACPRHLFAFDDDLETRTAAIPYKWSELCLRRACNIVCVNSGLHLF